MQRNIRDIQERVSNIQDDRMLIYGSYDKNVACRTAIETILFNYNRDKNQGTSLEFTEDDKTMLRDIISKLVRIAADPSWLDSVLDMESYVNFFNQFNPRYRDPDTQCEQFSYEYTQGD